jgi:hypothetical protein
MYLPKRGRGCWKRTLAARRSGLDLVLHAVAFPLDEDGLGVVQEAVEQSGGQGAVVIENLRPLLVDAV